MDPLVISVLVMAFSVAGMISVHLLVFRKGGYPHEASYVLAPGFIPVFVMLWLLFGTWHVFLPVTLIAFYFVRGAISILRFTRKRSTEGVSTF